MIKGINSFIKIALAPLNAIITGLNIPLKALGLKNNKIKIFQIPKLGTNNIPQDGLNYLHKGEVVPKKIQSSNG